MTIHLTIPGILEVVGAACVAGAVGYVVFALIVICRWGK